MKSLVSGVEVLPVSALDTDIDKTICITGHRKNRIALYENNPVLTYSAVKLMLYRYIDMAVEAGYLNFINGLAGGIDLWSAEYVIMKKHRNDHIRLISVMPFLRHADFMSENDRFLLENVEKNSDYLITVNNNPDITYSKHKSADSSDKLYRDRNYYMVDHSSAVIAFADNEQKFSGTFQTINYAYRNGKKICSFSTEKIHSIIEKSHSDIRTIGYEIALLENIFCT
ncbi:MAG: DUF1273 domain-containing protein [Ruminococcus sp.]|nr:DUF1273 domain-containing protein [Ruminococcus sp.]